MYVTNSAALDAVGEWYEAQERGTAPPAADATRQLQTLRDELASGDAVAPYEGVEVYLEDVVAVQRARASRPDADPLRVAAEIAFVVSDFNRVCEVAEYTDTGDAWEVFNWVRDAARSAQTP